MQQVLWIVHRVDALPIHLDGGRVVDEGVLFLAIGAAQPRADDVVVVMPSAGVYVIAQEVVEEVRVLSADFLDCNHVEIADRQCECLHDVRLAGLLVAEDLNVVRSDADRGAAVDRNIRRRRRRGIAAGKWSGQIAADSGQRRVIGGWRRAEGILWLRRPPTHVQPSAAERRSQQKKQ